METATKVYCALVATSVSAGFAFESALIGLTIACGGMFLGYLVEALVQSQR